MTESPTTGAVEVEPTEPTEGSRLRQERNAAVEEASGYRSLLVEQHLDTLGLKPDEGIGVAIVDSFEGKPTLEEIATHAAEKYKYEPPEPAVVAAQVTEPAARIEAVQTESAPVVPPPDVDEVVEAETKLLDPEATRQDAQNSVAAKMGRYQQVRDRIQPT